MADLDPSSRSRSLPRAPARVGRLITCVEAAILIVALVILIVTIVQPTS